MSRAGRLKLLVTTRKLSDTYLQARLYILVRNYIGVSSTWIVGRLENYRQNQHLATHWILNPDSLGQIVLRVINLSQ